MGGRNPNPNPHKQTSRRLKNWDGEEEKEPALQQALHIPSFTHEEANWFSRKGSSPKEKEQRSWCGSTTLALVFQEHKQRPQGNCESSEQGPKVTRVQQKKEVSCKYPKQDTAAGGNTEKKNPRTNKLPGRTKAHTLECEYLYICLSVCLSVLLFWPPPRHLLEFYLRILLLF